MVPTLVAPAIVDISVAQHLGRRNRILMTEVDIQGQAIGKGDAAGVDHARPIEDRLAGKHRLTRHLRLGFQNVIFEIGIRPATLVEQFGWRFQRIIVKKVVVIENPVVNVDAVGGAVDQVIKTAAIGAGRLHRRWHLIPTVLGIPFLSVENGIAFDERLRPQSGNDEDVGLGRVGLRFLHQPLDAQIAPRRFIRVWLNVKIAVKQLFDVVPGLLFRGYIGTNITGQERVMFLFVAGAGVHDDLVSAQVGVNDRRHFRLDQDHVAAGHGTVLDRHGGNRYRALLQGGNDALVGNGRDRLVAGTPDDVLRDAGR